MFLGEVIGQERRSSSAITALKIRPQSEVPTPTTSSKALEVPNPECCARKRLSAPEPILRRRSSIFRPPTPIEPTFSWNASSDERWSIVQSDGSEATLVYRRNESASMKNFGIEVRGLRDVDNLLQDAIIILRPKNVILKDLIEEVLCNICKTINGNEDFYKEVQKELFTDNSAHMFANTLQGFVKNGSSDTPDYDPSWLCAFCNLSQIKQRCVAIVRMKQPTNFGETCQEVRFFILVFCPSKSKETKTSLETARTFATLFSDPNLRNSLLLQPTNESFKYALSDWAARITNMAGEEKNEQMGQMKDEEAQQKEKKEKSCCGSIGSGIKADLKRRLPHYISDYTDGIADGRAIQKTISTSVFLYFACLLPTIAFATLNSETTHGRMDVRKGIFSQTVGQLIFSFIGGQHLSILLTTAPLSLFVKIIFSLSEYYDIVDQFEAFYCCVGLWTSLFLFLSAIFNMSKVMKYCTRSTEEIFALFISIAFLVYAIKDATHEFEDNYNSEACIGSQNTSFAFHPNMSHKLNQSIYHTLNDGKNECHRDSCLLYLLLMFGTFWFGFTLYNFKNTPFLQRNKREILSDYSLPIAVVTFSFIGSMLFRAVPAQEFNYDATKPLLQLAPLHKLEWEIVLLSAILGFCLAVLIFMDQNIGSAIVNNPSNQLTKGPSYNWDLVVISAINAVSSLFALPWLHVALPHAPMHVKCLADIEERVEHGQVKQIVVRVRETRLTTIFSHILMGLSLFLLPYPLKYILPSVFDGLYLYMGITALGGNQLFERILLVFTEQLSYPPNHYIRKVPQRKIHQFTLIQVLQLILLCVLGFFPFPFVKVLFPLVLLFLLYSRQKLIPKVIEKKYLDVLD